MSAVHTSVVRDAHSYTRSATPWILDEHKSVYGKLMHYLSGGGMRTFGRTVHQEEVRGKQRRFALTAAILGVAWLIVYLI